MDWTIVLMGDETLTRRFGSAQYGSGQSSNLRMTEWDRLAREGRERRPIE